MRFHSAWFLALAGGVASTLGAGRAFAQGTLPEANRIIFLGDSITYAGGYVADLETAIKLRYPDRRIEILNLGLPSETVSGLSEPGHAGGDFARPNLHERLTRVLDASKPDLVVACYGMNDGVYQPLSEDRFARFREGMEKLRKAVVERGAQIILLTPAYFDAHPIRDLLLPAGLNAYPQPYEDYDSVLEAYSKWLIDQRGRGWVVIDSHEAMKSATLAGRKDNPDFTFAPDGIHPNDDGHALLAEPLAEAWGLRDSLPNRAQHPNAAAIRGKVRRKQEILKIAWLTATGHTRPGIPEGLPLERAIQEAAAIDAEIHELCAGSRP